MIKRILVGLAGTAYKSVAIQGAVTLAQSHDAKVTGVTVLDRGCVRYEGSVCCGRFWATRYSELSATRRFHSFLRSEVHS